MNYIKLFVLAATAGILIYSCKKTYLDRLLEF